MGATIQIQISEEPTCEVVHRFRNFGEDIYGSLRESCSVSIEEIDATTNRFVVRDVDRRDLGRVTQTIKRLLRRHGFDSSATLTRL